MVAGLDSKKRLIRRLGREESNPADGNAPYDWASIVGFAGILFGLFYWFLISRIEVILYPSILLALIFGAIGLRRTKEGQRRGRGLALAAFIPGLVVFLVGIGIVITFLTTPVFF